MTSAHPKTSASSLEKTVHETVALASAEKKRLAEKGRKLIARVKALKEKRERMAHEMGRALAVLKEKAMVHALRFQSFEALCTIGIGISTDHADQLIDIAGCFTAKQASELGNAKATAVIGLARALGGEHTAAGLLKRRHLDVGRGKQVDVKVATADALHRVASSIRDRVPHAARRGVHLSAEEKAFIARLEKALHAQGIDARITGIAGSHEDGGKLRLDAPIRDARAVAKAVLAAMKQ